MKRCKFHFTGTQDTFATRITDEEFTRLTGDDAKPLRFVTVWGSETVTMNMDNVTYVEVEEVD